MALRVARSPVNRGTVRPVLSASYAHTNAARRARARGPVALLSLASVCLVSGCPSDDKPAPAAPTNRSVRSASATSDKRPCPAEAPAPPIIPYHRPEHDLVDFWLSRLNKPGRVLLAPDRILEHNRELLGQPGEDPPTGLTDLLKLTPPAARVKALLAKRLEHLREGVKAGKRVWADGSKPTDLLERLTTLQRRAEIGGGLHLLHRSEPLRCFPEPRGIYEKAHDLAFDLNQCSQVRTGEPVKVLARAHDYWFVRTVYGQGWVRPSALSRAIPAEELAEYLDPRRRVVVVADRVPLWDAARGGQVVGSATLGAQFPRIVLKKEARPAPVRRRKKDDEPPPRRRVSVPTAAGLTTRWLDQRGTTLGFSPFSREAVLRRAFSLLHTPYGWGGTGGRRDCSRLMMDLFASFGLRIPRNTAQQSHAGARRVDVGHLDETAKAAAMAADATDGVVLMNMKGHIMLYVGSDGDRQFGLHLFSGYLQPCPGGGETMMRVNRTAVTSLGLGRGSSRRSFLRRITRLIVFGRKKSTVGDADLR